MVGGDALDVHVGDPHRSGAIRIDPDHGVARRQASLPMVVLPLPEPPTSATLRPGSTSRLKSSTTGGSMLP